MATLIYRAGGALKERLGATDQIDINLFRLLIAASSAVSRKLSAESTAWEFNESTPSSQRLTRICWTNFLKVMASQELSASARP
jgi:hypothetical protein